MVQRLLGGGFRTIRARLPAWCPQIAAAAERLAIVVAGDYAPPKGVHDVGDPAGLLPWHRQMLQ